MNKKKYQTPTMKVCEMEPASIICQSPSGIENEKYEVVNPDDWF